MLRPSAPAPPHVRRRPANGRSVWIAAGLTVFVAAFEHFVLRLPYGRYFSDVFEVQDPLGFGIRDILKDLAICSAQKRSTLKTSIRFWRARAVDKPPPTQAGWVYAGCC
jgi:hypothetical protein